MFCFDETKSSLQLRSVDLPYHSSKKLVAFASREMKGRKTGLRRTGCITVWVSDTQQLLTIHTLVFMVCVRDMNTSGLQTKSSVGVQDSGGYVHRMA